MRNKSSWPKSCLLILFFAVLLFALPAFLFLRGAQRVQKVANIPPTVVVYAPEAGESIQADDTLLAYVVATSQNPITRLELWLDGALLETRNPDTTLGEVTTFSVSTELHIQEGPHIFSARAVDAKGLVGQSLPVPLLGKPGATVIIAEGDQSLEDIAAASGSDIDLLKEINPGLGDSALPDGTGVIVPAPGGGQDGNAGAIIIPPAPLPAAPAGVTIMPITSPIPDIGTLISLLLSARPKAPNSLQAGAENCTIRLLWMDNADNETYFNVWMQALGGPPKVIATLTGSPQTGPAWYEFDSPWVGFYSFWVEAVNSLGAQSSEIAWVGIKDLSCGPGIATHLNIETTYMFVQGGYDNVYCYLSVEGTPEKRIPSNSSQFVPVSGGWGEVSNWTGNGIGNGGNSFLLPEPVDGEVNLEATCLGWQGGSGPDNLGTAIASAPKATWDGRGLELQGAGYTIGYRIQPHGPGAANGSFTYVDYSLPLPFKPWVTVETSTKPLERDRFARNPTVHWNWNGDQSILTGFTLIMNGKPIKTITNKIAGNTPSWSESVILPTSCGGVYVFEVAANSGEAMSDLSMPYEHIQPPCTTYAEIKFESIKFGCLDDGDAPVIPFVSMDCESGSFGNQDTIEAYYWIAVHGEMVNITPGDMTTQITYSFHDLGSNSPQRDSYPSYDTFLVPIDPANPAIWFGLNLKDEDPIWDANDHICGIGKDVVMPYQDWDSYDEVFELECSSRDGYGWVKVRVRGFPSLDADRSPNPGIGQPIGP